MRNSNPFVFALTAVLMGLVCASAGLAQEEPLLKPDVAKLDVLPKKEPLKGGVEHNFKGGGDEKAKKKKKLKASAGAAGYQPKSRLGASLDNNRFNSQIDESRLEAQAERSIGVIGVRFVSTNGYPPVINTVFPGTPAATAGVVPNDLIVAVDGVPTSGLTRDECYDLIIGTPNTPVTLSLRRGHNFFVRTMNRMDLNEMTDPRVRNAYMYHL
jgi:membrane-associated protease RseP (regulator of RpoE activity)